MTAAAATFYLTPSAVSQQLAALEQETGHALLARDGRGVRLTAAGEILLSHADAVLAQLERAEADLAAYAAGAHGQVTVASFATGISLVLAPAIGALADSAPGVRLKVLDAEGDASLPMLLDGQADLAVAVEYRGAPRADDQRLARFPLYAEPFEAVLPLDHRLAGQPGPVAMAALATEPWIGPYPGNPCHDVVLLACEHAGFTPRLVHSSDDFSAVVALASAARGGPGAPLGTARCGPHPGRGARGRQRPGDPQGLRGGAWRRRAAPADPSGTQRPAEGSGGAGLTTAHGRRSPWRPASAAPDSLTGMTSERATW